MRKQRNGPLITAEELREILSYDPDTGEFRWKIRKSGIKLPKNSSTEKIAGTIKHTGYNVIGINRKYYTGHWLAWLYTTGSFPKHQIDHINGNRADNRISNLRHANARENCCNRKSHRNGRFFGCNKLGKKWVSRITIGEHRKYIGSFSSEEAAHHTYLVWKHNLGL